MTNRILAFLLFLSSFFGYMEWGATQKMFLYEMEMEVMGKFFKDPLSMMHPLILFPLAGQFILLWSTGVSNPKRLMLIIGIGGLAILFILILLAGILSSNIKMMCSTLPFLGFAAYYIGREWRSSTPRT